MSGDYCNLTKLREFPLWEKIDQKRIPLSFELEITARCNNECRHCYINLNAGDKAAREMELTLDEIGHIAGQAVKLGSLWCLLTGGEPLLRDDFKDIYILLKRKGLLVSLFTNACLITPDHVDLFKKYPPRDVEVTVYGVSRETYEKVTRKPGSYAAFRRGLNLLLENRIKVTLKAMALRSNFRELPAVAAFCRQHTKDFFRFDPFLHLRYDGNDSRNREILAERLPSEEIVRIEQADEKRFGALKKNCEKFFIKRNSNSDCRHLFYCQAGKNSFTVSPDGFFRLCASLWQSNCVYDLKKGTLAEAWNVLVPSVRSLTSSDPQFLEKCHSCPLINLCLWCPAHAHLESGRLDAWIDYFCQVAHARAEMLKSKTKKQGSASIALKKNSKSILNSGPRRKDTPPIS